MHIKQYIQDNGLRAEWFAKQIPCSNGYFSLVSSRKAKPSPIIINRIFDLTKGQVTKDDYEVKEKKEKND